jgi:hypothetical protein
MPEWSLPQLVEYVRMKKILVPVFQREFVWSESQVVLLSESIYKGYPIGLIVLFEEEPGKFLILDGQQRILSIYMMSGNPIEMEKASLFINVWFNPIDCNFKSSKRNLSYPWIRLCDVINKKPEELPSIAEKLAKSTVPGHLEEVKEVGRILSVINGLWSRFQNYKISFYTVPQECDIDSLGEIYDRINFGGKKVESTDIIYSIIAIKNEDVAKGIRSLHRELKAKRWDIDLSVLVRIFLSILTDGRIKLRNRVLEQASEIKKKLEDRSKEIKRIFDDTNFAIKEATKFISDDELLAIKSTDSKILLSQAPLLIIAYIMWKIKGVDKMNEEDKLLLAKWFVLSQYHRRYSSAAETRLNEDLDAYKKESIKGLIYELRKQVRADLIPEESEIEGRGEDKLLLLYSMLRFNRASDLFDKNEHVNSYFVIHHIFPKSITPEYDELFADDIANITFLKETTNKIIGSQEPIEYLTGIDEEVVKKHFIPSNCELWKRSGFKEFIKERRKLIAQSIKKTYEDIEEIITKMQKEVWSF